MKLPSLTDYDELSADDERDEQRGWDEQGWEIDEYRAGRLALDLLREEQILNSALIRDAFSSWEVAHGLRNQEPILRRYCKRVWHTMRYAHSVRGKRKTFGGRLTPAYDALERLVRYFPVQQWVRDLGRDEMRNSAFTQVDQAANLSELEARVMRWQMDGLGVELTAKSVDRSEKHVKAVRFVVKDKLERLGVRLRLKRH